MSALALVGCASAPGASAASCERPTTDSSAIGLIDVTGEFGDPTVTVEPPVYVDETVFADEIVGEGRAVTTRAQDVQFTTAILNGKTGETLVTAPSQVLPVSQWATQYEGIAKMLECATEGSRIVGAVPADDLGEQAATSLGVADGESAVFVIDLHTVYLAAADGVPQRMTDNSLPQVVLAPDGRPGIVVPDSDPPADLAVEVLKKGDGEEVTADSNVRVHYTGVTWAEREVFDSSWEKGASATFTLDGVVPGFAQALEGQTVGSQVLAVIPPELGYGDQASGSIPAGSTLVFVIDILGIDQTPTQ
nr:MULTISPECIES: FKBP-type peptidyl-prolyl cis-trans isomerase [Microbacterium]